jgi:hypothetical protein
MLSVRREPQAMAAMPALTAQRVLPQRQMSSLHHLLSGNGVITSVSKLHCATGLRWGWHC